MKELPTILLSAALAALQALTLFNMKCVRDDVAAIRTEVRATMMDHERRIALVEGRTERRYP